MRNLAILPICTAVLALASCSQDQLTQDDLSNDIKDKYTKAWISKFGLIDSKQDWNMATSVQADVDPSVFGDGATLRIYTDRPEAGGCLVGYATVKGSVSLNVPKDASRVYVVARDRSKNIVEAGYYDISGGSVSIDAPSRSRAVSRDGGLDATPYFAWMIACEDLGTIGDFDFNDIVLGVNVVAVDAKKKVSITPMAAGGTLEASVYIGETEVGEIHSLIDPLASYTTMLNTGGFVKAGETRTYVLDAFDISANMGGIKIVVRNGGGNQNATIITPSAPGEAPQMFLISGDWEWPAERVSITTAYPAFAEWSQNAEASTWTAIPSGTSTVEWREALDAAGTSTTTDPEDDPAPDPEVICQSLNMIENQGYPWSGSWTHDSKTWDYVPGLVTNAILAYCDQYDDYSQNGTYSSEDASTQTPFAAALAYADRAFNGSSFNESVFVKGQLDNVASGKVILALYRMAKAGKGKLTESDAAKYKTAADYIYNYITDTSSEGYPRIADGLVGAGGFYHKYNSTKSKSYTNQMWLDGLYMGAAFYAEYLHTFDITDADKWTDVFNQFNIIHTHTWNSVKKLNHHGWATKNESGEYDVSSFWAKAADAESGRNEGCSEEFWGRGMGWYFAALVDVLDYMPTSHARYNDLLAIYRQVADGLKARQDASGAWYQLLQYDSSVTASSRNDDVALKSFFDSNTSKKDQELTNAPNYLEASASFMFTYAYLKGLRLGLLDENTYGTVAENAYAGLSQFLTFDSDGNVNGTQAKICKSAGLGPYTELCRDGSIASYLVGYDVLKVANEGKGIGSYLFASLEWEKRQQSK